MRINRAKEECTGSVNPLGPPQEPPQMRARICCQSRSTATLRACMGRIDADAFINTRTKVTNSKQAQDS